LPSNLQALQGQTPTRNVQGRIHWFVVAVIIVTVVLFAAGTYFILR
jgi:hypothetical protein